MAQALRIIIVILGLIAYSLIGAYSAGVVRKHITDEFDAAVAAVFWPLIPIALLGVKLYKGAYQRGLKEKDRSLKK